MSNKANVSNNVLVTNKLNQFKLLGANRDVNSRHVDALVKSLEENGNFLSADPILVNERMEVIDGQHRLEACKRLGLPVYYVQVSGLAVDQARRMNILHRRWNTTDFLESYAKENRRAYVQLMQLKEEYPDFPLTTILIYAEGQQNQGYGSRFRRGEFEPFNMDETHAKLDRLSEMAELTPAFNTKALAIAFLNIMNSENYDHGRMLKKVKQHAADIRTYQNVADNMRQLENIYNEGFSTNRARLY